MAILAGDGLQAEAFRLLAREPQGHHPTLMTRKLRVLVADRRRGGRAGHGRRPGDRSRAPSAAPGRRRHRHAARRRTRLRDMHARKTGALIRASVAAGAVMAGADDALFAALDQLRHRDRPRLSDRRRHPRRRRLGGDARQDRRQGSRRRQADLSRRSSASIDRARWPPSVIARRDAGARASAGCSTRGSPTSRAGSLTRKTT